MRLFFFFFCSFFFFYRFVDSVHHTQKRSHRTACTLLFQRYFFLYHIFPPSLVFFFFFNFPRLIRFHSFHSPIPLSFSNTCSMRFYFIYLLFCFFPLISKESYSQYQRMLLFERFCFVSFFVTISIFLSLSLSLSLSLVFLSARDMIYMFWMSCRVASISSCSNLFFSLSAARSSGKITGQRVAAHAHQDTKWTRSDFLDHRNTLKGLQRVRKETCRSLSKCILHTRRRDTTILRHCYFRSSSSSTLVLKSANT